MSKQLKEIPCWILHKDMILISNVRKLADLLGKYIDPVLFLWQALVKDHWHVQLAMLFVTKIILIEWKNLQMKRMICLI